MTSYRQQIQQSEHLLHRQKSKCKSQTHLLLIVLGYFVLPFCFLSFVSVHTRFESLSTRAHTDTLRWLCAVAKCIFNQPFFSSICFLSHFLPFSHCVCAFDVASSFTLLPSLSLCLTHALALILHLARSLPLTYHSNCSLICCDRSNCHHLPAGGHRRRTYLCCAVLCCPVGAVCL